MNEAPTTPKLLIPRVVMNFRLAATCSTLMLPLLVSGPGAALADSQPMRMNNNITD